MILIEIVSQGDVGNDHVHQSICHYPSPGSTVSFVYMITSEDAVFAGGKLPSNAISYHLHRTSRHGGHGEVSCSCCFGLQDDALWKSLPVHRRGAESESHTRSAVRNYLWHKAAYSIGADTRYVIFLDSSSGLPPAHVLERFQSWLMQTSPNVGVPYHPCNVKDTNSNNSACVTNVYDLALVAIRSAATKLLLPIDEAVFSLLCHLMLRGTVTQFDYDQDRITKESNLVCEDKRNVANQDALCLFASSLRSEEFALALPFSPRLLPAVAPRPVLFRSDGSVALLGDSSSGSICPVDCSMSYWQLHPVFDCCRSVSHVSTAPYDAQAAYAEIARKWNLPRRANLLCDLSHGTRYSLSEIRRYNHSLLTHPLPKFQISLDRPHVVFEHAGFHSSCRSAAANHLHAFKVTLQPDRFEVRAEGNRHAQVVVVMQVTVSSEDLAHSVIDAGYAIFGRFENLRFDSVCHGMQFSTDTNVSLFEYFASTDTDFSSAIAPWFYSPGPGWFEVASNVTDDARDCLRSLLFNVTIGSVCEGRMYIKATGSLLLRAVSSNGAPCLSHVVISSSLNSSFDATNETLRASFLSEDVPSDLFDDASSSHCESTDDRPGSCGSTVERSDFSCAGPNRFWPYDEQGHTKLFDRIDSGEIVNMCLLHNVCWENSKLVLYLPPPFADLEAMGLFQFPSLGIGNPWIGSDHRRFLWSPQIKFESFPRNVRFALNITHYLMLKSLPHHEARNMGHILLEDLSSVFHALESFDLLDTGGRIVLYQNVSITDHIHGLIPASRSYPFFLFPHTTSFIEDYPSGTCFERMVVGHLAIEWLWQFSLHRSGHYMRFRKFYLQQLQLEHIISPWVYRPRVVVNFYPRVRIGQHRTWIDVCKLSRQLLDTFPDAEFRCISMQSMNIEMQAQLIAAAALHVWPNGVCNFAFARNPQWLSSPCLTLRLLGGSAYGLIFAAEGASAIILADEDKPAMETKLLMMLPWVNVYYMHRQEEHFFALFLFRAMSSASLRMRFPMPFSKLSERDVDA